MSPLGLRLKSTKGGEVFEVSIAGDALIGDLKAEVEARTSIPRASQRLIYKGRMLKEDAQSLSAFGLQSGDTILYMASARAAPAPARPAQAAAPSAPAAAAGPPGPRVPPAAPAAPAPAFPFPFPLGAGAGGAVPETAFTRALASLGPPSDGERRREAVRTLGKVISNIIAHPMDEKYRTLKKANAAFQRRLGGVPGASECLSALGFQDRGEQWVLVATASGWERLLSARSAVDRASGSGPPPSPLLQMLPEAQRARMEALLADPQQLQQMMRDFAGSPMLQTIAQNMMGGAAAPGAPDLQAVMQMMQNMGARRDGGDDAEGEGDDAAGEQEPGAAP